MGKKRPKSRPVRLAGAQNTPSSASGSVDDEMYSALASTPVSAPSIFIKVCRLCETKDGPFLNIFDADKVTAKRIDEVLPFAIEENDELPHKICFRCSAKLEELYEFILKCIKTQDSLRTAMGARFPLVTKSRFRVQWEKHLNKKNISNDDICNALIKKAMEGIKNIAPNPMPLEEEKLQPAPIPANKKGKNSVEPVTSKKDKTSPSSKNNITYQSDESDEPDDVNLKQVKLTIEKCDNKPPVTRSTRSNKAEAITPDEIVDQSKKIKQYSSRKPQSKAEPPVVESKPTNSRVSDKSKSNDNTATSVVSDDKNKDKSDGEKPQDREPEAPPPPPPPINIMDHVTAIKVNSVGTLFLCKLCNRNFLKKEIVLAHGCAKNNVPKDKFLHNAPPREIPKPPVTVKYIKMNTDIKKPVENNKKIPAEVVPSPKSLLKVNTPEQPDIKPKVKPRAGPASRVKRFTKPAEVPKESTPPPSKPQAPQEEKAVPSVDFPTMPSLNSRYKLVPGPNNTFTLVEDSAAQNQHPTPQPTDTVPKLLKKRKMGEDESENASRQFGSIVPDKELSSEVIDLDDNDPPQPAVIEQPYPVGLFTTTPHHSGSFAPNIPKTPTFSTSALKKQSYTIVQTGNPSKLLISTKPQPVAEEPQRKKSKKATKPEVAEENPQAKDSGFFTFINVDPLVQPSYVLPTDNIIQESQISTSTPASKAILDSKDRDKYSCNMCEEKFSREKKLLAHIQSHFNQMDEEDQMRREKSETKKKTKK